MALGFLFLQLFRFLNMTSVSLSTLFVLCLSHFATKLNMIYFTWTLAFLLLES